MSTRLTLEKPRAKSSYVWLIEPYFPLSQCYRRQRTCQHDPEHRRRRRIAIAPKKPAPATPEDLSVELPPPFDVDADDSAGTRMESEEPSVLPAAVDGTFTRLVPIPVKDEEVDQLETDWMQPE